MTPTSFASALERIGKDAKMGFEFECFVGEKSDLFRGEPSPAVPVLNLDRIGTLADFLDVFYMSMAEHDKLRKDLAKWKVDNPGKMWIDYIKDEYDSVERFVQLNDLKPIYGWTDHKEDTVYTEHPATSDHVVPYQDVADAAIAALKEWLGKNVVDGVSKSEWAITDDGSINSHGNGPGVGIEIVSPPLPTEEALDGLQSIFRFIKKYDLVTNESTGLHINISIPHLRERLDPLKLILFMGEEHILEKWARTNNEYTKSHAKEIVDDIKNHGVPKETGIFEVLNRFLSKHKYHTVNLSKLAAGYLEFRVAGGDNYHEEIQKVNQTIGRFLSALEIACSADLERQQYLKKASKLFGAAISAAKSGEPMETAEEFLQAGGGYSKTEQLLGLVKDDADENTAAYVVSSLIVRVIGFMQRRNLDPSTRVKIQVRQIFRKLLAKYPDLWEKVKDKLVMHEHQDLEDFIRIFGLSGK